MGPEVWLRLFAAGIGAYVVVRGVLRLGHLWKTEPSEVRLLFLSVIIFGAAAVHGTLEAVARMIPAGPRSVSAIVACCVAALAVSLPKRWRMDAEPPSSE